MPSETLAILFLSLSIITSSIYVFPSGTPQLTDFLSLIAFFALISKRQPLEFMLENIKEKKNLIIFVAIYSFANVFSLRFFPTVSIDGTLTAIAYVYFNVAIYLSFNYFFYKPASYNYLLNACLICSLIDFASVFFTVKIRGQGFMNNPNQFGVHILCLLILSMLISKNNLLSWKPIVILLLLITPALQSGSKAALVASFPIIISFFYNLFNNANENILKLLQFIKSKLVAIIIVLLLILLVVNLFPNIFSEFQQLFDRSFNFSLNRLLNMSQEADSDIWYARRVYLITKLNRLGWATGIGYDNYFERLGEFQEIHSLFPSLIVISGVFSAIFFGLFFLVRLYKNRDFYSWSAIAGILLYSITHQFLRDSNMWAILGLMK